MSAVKGFDFQKVIGGNVEASVFAIQDGTRSNTIRNITDLSGTKWLINKPSEIVFVAPPEGESLSFHADINCKMSVPNTSIYDSANHTRVAISQFYDSQTSTLHGIVFMPGIPNEFSYPYLYIVSAPSAPATEYSVHYATDSSTDTNLGDIETIVEFTDGDDVRNSRLIEWLNTNATLVEEPVVPKSSFDLIDSDFYIWSAGVSKYISIKDVEGTTQHIKIKGSGSSYTFSDNNSRCELNLFPEDLNGYQERTLIIAYGGRLVMCDVLNIFSDISIVDEIKSKFKWFDIDTNTLIKQGEAMIASDTDQETPTYTDYDITTQVPVDAQCTIVSNDDEPIATDASNVDEINIYVKFFNKKSSFSNIKIQQNGLKDIKNCVLYVLSSNIINEHISDFSKLEITTNDDNTWTLTDGVNSIIVGEIDNALQDVNGNYITDSSGNYLLVSTIIQSDNDLTIYNANSNQQGSEVTIC